MNREWLKFGIYGMLLSICASGICVIADEYVWSMGGLYDLYHPLGAILLILSFVILLFGLIMAFKKDGE